MFSTPHLDPTSSPVVVFILTILAFASFYPLILLIELVALQLLRWGKFRACLNVSWKMNAFTFMLGMVLLTIFPKPNAFHLLVYLAISVVVEMGVLSWFKRGAPRQNWTAALIANAASYFLLIVPAFLFGNR